MLSTDGMFSARGWDPVGNGEALWNNWVELRTPIAEQVLWLDGFFDAASVWEDPAQIGTLGPSNMMFGLGAGLRFTIPQFPIRVYLAKRFAIDAQGRLDMQQGTLFNYNDSPTGGLDFVFSIGPGLF